MRMVPGKSFGRPADIKYKFVLKLIYGISKLLHYRVIQGHGLFKPINKRLQPKIEQIIRAIP